MEHAKSRPDLTLGVAAFSAAQAQAIEDQLEILRRTGDPPCEGFFASHPFEPFFVKNLENVQGDERDVIFISVGYGKTAEGRVHMSFGPLNREGGERRLNVLISRARRVCEVFTNLTADDIDLSQTDSRGVRALKTFLKYAREGRLDVPEATGREPDSPFEESVLSVLRGLGYQVEPQVGSAGFFIDLAVVDPERPGRYLLGVECDGATYHSARSARDRDRLRQEVLEDLGWRIHRVWSTDWFRNPDNELKRLVEAIEEARLYGGTPESMSQAEQSDVAEIARDTVPAQPKAPSLPTYEVADLRLAKGSDVADWVAEVVRVESPVHVQEVSRRITKAASIKRTGSRIRATIERGCEENVREGRARRLGEFLWRPDMREAPLRDRSQLPDASKKLEFVAPEEIAAAIERMVADSFGMDRGEIAAAVLRLLLGFRRATEAAQRQVIEVLDGLITEGRLVGEGNHVSLRG